MLVVVDPHRLLVDVRLQSGVVVWQGGKRERHDRLLGRDFAIPNDLLGSSAKYDRGRRRGQRGFAPWGDALTFRWCPPPSPHSDRSSQCCSWIASPRCRRSSSPCSACSLRRTGSGPRPARSGQSGTSRPTCSTRPAAPLVHRDRSHRHGPGDRRLRLAGGVHHRMNAEWVAVAADESADPHRAARGDRPDGDRAVPVDRSGRTGPLGRGLGGGGDVRALVRCRRTIPSAGCTSSRSVTPSARGR